MNIPRVRPFPLLAGLLALPSLALAQAAGAVIPAEVQARALALATEAAQALAPPQAQVLVQSGSFDPRLNLAPCAKIQPYLGAGVPVWGRTRVGLRCEQGAVRWNVFLPVTVQVLAPALVSTVALPAGARLAESQLQLAPTDWAAATQPPHTDMNMLAGRTLARAVAAGQPLRATDLQARQYFSLGDTISIVAAGQGYAISAEGQALTPGLEGQNARVRTENGRVLVGRPIGERRIEVVL